MRVLPEKVERLGPRSGLILFHVMMLLKGGGVGSGVVLQRSSEALCLSHTPVPHDHIRPATKDSHLCNIEAKQILPILGLFLPSRLYHDKKLGCTDLS